MATPSASSPERRAAAIQMTHDALQRHRLEHGEFPQSLDALAEVIADAEARSVWRFLQAKSPPSPSTARTMNQVSTVTTRGRCERPTGRPLLLLMADTTVTSHTSISSLSAT